MTKLAVKILRSRIQIGLRNSTDDEDPKIGTGYRMHTILEKRNSGWVIQFSFHEF